MDTGKFIGLLVFFLVGALVLVAFVPAIQETTSATKTFENEGYFKVAPLDGDYSFTWDYDEPNVFVVNDEPITWVNDTNLDISVMCSEKMFVRADKSGVAVYFNGDSAGNVIANQTNPTLTVTRTSGTISVTNGDITRTLTDTTDTYCIATEGDYVMKKINTPVYMTDDSLIYGRGYSAFPPKYFPTFISGTIESVTAVVPTGYSSSDVTINKESVSGYEDLYLLNNLTFVVTDDDSNDHNVTYNYFVVPASVTVEKTIHADTTLATVINLLPLIAGVGLLMFLVGEFLYTRYL